MKGGLLLASVAVCACAMFVSAQALAEQVATANGPCAIAANVSGTGNIVHIHGSCDPAILATVATIRAKQLALERTLQANTARQRSVELRLSSLEEQERRQLGEATGAVLAVTAIGKKSKSVADQQAATSLAVGDPAPAAALLGREAAKLAGGKGGDRHAAATLYRQQATLLRSFDAEQALESLKSALSLEPSDLDALRDARDAASLLGRTRDAMNYSSELNKATLLRLASDPGNRELRLQLAVSYDRLGDDQSNTGDLQKALETYRQALRVAKSIPAKESDSRVDDQLALIYSRIGVTLSKCGSTADALGALRASDQILERLSRSDPQSFTWWAGLAMVDGHIGDILLLQGDVDGAIKTFRRLQDESHDTAARASDAEVLNYLVILRHQTAGAVHRAQHRYDAAVSDYTAAVDFARQLLVSHPGYAGILDGLSSSLGGLGDAHLGLEQYSLALASYEESRQVALQLRAKDPEGWRDTYAVELASAKAAQALLMQDELDRGFTLFSEIAVVAQSMSDRNSTDSDWRAMLYLCRSGTGWVHMQRKQWPEALADFEVARRAAQHMVDLDQANEYGRRLLVRSLDWIGYADVARGQVTQALASMYAAKDLHVALAPSNRRDPTSQHDLSDNLERIGDAEKSLGHLGLAMEAYGQALQAESALRAIDPDEAPARLEIAVLKLKTASLGRMAGSIAERLTMLRSSQELLAGLRDGTGLQDTDRHWIDDVTSLQKRLSAAAAKSAAASEAAN